jgi:cytochrome c oxidase cbb3-type subunit 3
MKDQHDGIEELDNQLPNWWLGTLYGTIAFAVIYGIYYTLGGGPSQTEELAHEQARWESVYARPESVKVLTKPELVAIFKDPARQAQGQAVFRAKCAACHGSQGQGGIGPNLTDRFWLHGGKPLSILKTITSGVPEKGMPPWGSILSQDEIHDAAAYIRSLAGTSPPNPKAPQGEPEQD